MLICSNISCPVSHLGSPLLHQRSVQNMNGRVSPSPISSPRNISGSSTPLNGAIPFYHHQPSVLYTPEFTGLGMSSRSPTRCFGPPPSYYHDPRPDMFRAMPQGSPFFQEIVPSDNDFLGNQKERYSGQSVLVNRVSEQLLRDHVKQNPVIDLNPPSPVVSRRRS